MLTSFTTHLLSILHSHHKVQIPREVLRLFCDSPLQTRSAGFGVQLAFDGVQVDLILPAGTKLSLHLKNTWAPPTVVMLWKFSMIPFSGAWGIPQLTGGRRKRMVWRYTETEVDQFHPAQNIAQMLLCKVLHKIKLLTMQVYICKRKHVKDYTEWFSNPKNTYKPSSKLYNILKYCTELMMYR